MKNKGIILLAAVISMLSMPISAATMVGDINRDNTVDTKDAEILSEYFAGHGHTIDETIADMNQDGELTRKDGMILSRYANGWQEYDLPDSEEVPEIYVRELKEEHVQTATLKYNGSSYEGMYVDNELIVVIDEDAADRDYVEEIVSPYGGTVVGQVPSVGFYQVAFGKTMTAVELENLCKTIRALESVEDAYLNTVYEYETDTSEDAYYPNDPFDLTESSLEIEKDALWRNRPSTWHLRATRVPEAWKLVKEVNTNPSIRIGIVDKLFDNTQEDLQLNLAIQHYADPFIRASKYPDVAMHGTHVAGIIGAQMNNKKGVAGVALGAEMVARTTVKNRLGMMSSMAEWVSDLTALIELDCKIINMSLGMESYNVISKKVVSDAEEKITPMLKKMYEDEKNFLLVTTAGNKGEDNHEVNYNNFLTKITDPDLTKRIIVVGNAVAVNGDTSTFSQGFMRATDSSYSGDRVDVMAPGEIFSTVPVESEESQESGTSGYAWQHGTSQAAPFITGVAALVWEANPELTPEQVKEIIVKAARIDVADSDVKMIDAEYAVKLALGNYCGEDLTWELKMEDSTLTIYGTGAMWEKDEFLYERFPWLDLQYWISNIVLAPNVTSISSEAFYGRGVYRYKLKSVTVAEGEYTIGDYEVERSIGDKAFYDCSGLTEITLPEGVRSIGNESFYSCSKLNSIVLPEGLTSIGMYTFFNCGLTSITLPEGLNSIGKYAFGNCSRLSGTIILPEGLTNIEEGVFSNCRKFGSVSLPESLTSIGDYAFRECSISDIDFPEGLTSIGHGAFMDSPLSGYMPGITLPKSLTSIGAYAFSGCKVLESITLPEGLTSIGDSAFSWCRKLKKISLPESLTSIGSGAFSWCTSLEKITIPKNITKIEDNTFSHCERLWNVTFPENLTSIGNRSFDSCSNLWDQYFNLPESLTSIGEYAFINSSFSDGSLPAGLTSIGKGAFYRCGLMYVTLPEGLTNIEDETFWDCYGLKRLTLPESLTSIGDRAFQYCVNLKSVYFRGNAPSKVGETAFEPSSILTLYYVDGTSGWDADIWKSFNLATWTP